MIDLRDAPFKDIPFKGKPLTNGYIQMTLTVAGICTVGMIGHYYPGLALIMVGGFGLGYLTRYIYKDIRGEWRHG